MATELIGHSLSFCDVRSLANAASVNREWKELIQESPFFHAPMSFGSAISSGKSFKDNLIIQAKEFSWNMACDYRDGRICYNFRKGIS